MADAASCVGRVANTKPVRGIRPPFVCGFEPPDTPPAARSAARVPHRRKGVPRMPRKPDPTPPHDEVVMPADAFKALSAFHQELHGIVRTLQPEVLAAIGYPASCNHQLLRDIFQALAQRLAPVMDACVRMSADDESSDLPTVKCLH